MGVGVVVVLLSVIDIVRELVGVLNLLVVVVFVFVFAVVFVKGVFV
jgi:hypothetical protein